MPLFDRFSAAFPLDHFLVKYANAAHRPSWQQTFDAVKLTDDQKILLASFKREMNVMVLAGAWCGDCAQQCPIFDRFAEAAKVVNVRYLDNAEHADVQDALSINGGKRIPVA